MVPHSAPQGEESRSTGGAARWLTVGETGWLDVVVTVALMLVAMPWALHHDPAHQALMIGFSIALAAPLVVARRWPFLSFAVIAAVAFVQWLVTIPVVTDCALLVALFVVGLRESRRHLLAAAIVLEFGVLLALVRYDKPNANWIIALVMLSGLVVAAAMLGRNVRMHVDQLEEAHQRAARLEFERDQQAEIATAAERTRIARDLHDIVAHHLAVMIALIDGAEHSFDRQPDQARDALKDAGTVGRRAMTDLRQALGVLRGADGLPERSPAPRIADLDALVTAAADTGLTIWADIDPDLDNLPDATQLTVYRIVQEAITNVIKHADSATSTHLEVRRAAGQLTVRITDNGVNTGIGTSGAGASRHGLLGMRERVAVHGGLLQTGPIGHGWQVTAILPEGNPR